MTARRRPAAWGAGAWFGCQVGGTAWLATGAVEMAQSAPSLATAWAVLCVAANGLGTWLWRRHRSGHPRAGQLILLACGVAGLVALVALDVVRPAGAESGAPAVAYLVVLGVPAILVAVAAPRRLPPPDAATGTAAQ